MKNLQNKTKTEGMARLLELGQCFDLGIPSWILNEMVSREKFQISPKDVFGLGNSSSQNNIVGEYMNKKGYEFSWGSMSENVYQDEDDATWIGTFEILPKVVLMAFPQGAMIEDLFIWMYQNHPLRHDEFNGEESFGDWFVLSFSAYGLDEIARLRSWLATTFIEHVIPDLISEALRIVAAEKLAGIADGSVDVMREDGRFQLCGDPVDLSFYAAVRSNDS